MSLFDLILNLSALLLWLSWCSRHLDPLTRTTPATIIGTVRRAEPRPSRGWHWLAGLGLVLVVRALFYHQVGSAVAWTPKLDLGFVVLAFRSDRFGPIVLFSLLSFVRVLIAYYFWLLTLVLINSAMAEPDPIQKLLRAHLGAMRRWPRPVLAALPVVCVAVIWIGLRPVLQWAGVLAPAQGFTHLLEQSLLLVLTLVLSLKYLLPVFLLLHVIASYVYLGVSPLWDFVSSTARNTLKPVSRLPLHMGKVDLAPLAGILLILLLFHWIPNLIQSELAKRNLSLWPQ